jgi:hypothetical protein
MFTLVNTMTQVLGDSIGTVISQHRTLDAAEHANTILQRAVKRANGNSSYLPTRIVEAPAMPRGRHVRNSDWRVLER